MKTNPENLDRYRVFQVVGQRPERGWVVLGIRQDLPVTTPAQPTAEDSSLVVVVAIKPVIPRLLTAGTLAILGFHQLVELALQEAIRLLDPGLMGRLGASLTTAGRTDPTTRSEEPQCSVL